MKLTKKVEEAIRDVEKANRHRLTTYTPTKIPNINNRSNVVVAAIHEEVREKEKRSYSRLRGRVFY